MGSIIEVTNETESSCSRITKEGRKITYKLRVIQQPARARACGSGAKSSADRRPVDPPPIVELLIYEGDNADNDITVSMNANYFLFATLEPARHIAAGRGQQEQQKLTVLTGTPVAGLVYLDRPSPAGYFLFPDLSVRHEGNYRLGFNLYEELKEEKDEDRVDETKPSMVGPTHVSHRLEVKSAPFVVFSAKKFPGLNRSTELSRLVAEQGCRVRIRRDIRIKKRGKDGKEVECEDDENDGYGAETEHVHTLHRPRSTSVDSQHSLAPRVQPHDTPHAHHQPSAAMPRPAGLKIYGYDQHPSLQQSSPQYGPPPPSAGSMPPPSAGPYGYQHYPAGPPHHGLPPSARPHESSPPLSVHTGSVARGVPPTPQSVATAVSPISNASEGHRDISPAVSLGRSHRMLPSINTGSHIPARLLEPSSPSSAGPSPSYSESAYSIRGTTGQRSGGKRTYSEVFDPHHAAGPMRHGARPMAGMAPNLAQLLAVDTDDSSDDLLASLKMRYRRADGRQISKHLD